MKILTAPQSGSQAGTTSSRNRFGQYLRSRATPVQPRTPKQTYVRGLFSSASSQWRTLTDAERDAWNTYASGLQRSDSLGQSYTPTGAEIFTGAVISSQTLTTPDVPLTPPLYLLLVNSITYTGPTPGPEAFEISIDRTDANNKFTIETSGPVSNGVTSAAAVRRWVSLPNSSLNTGQRQFSMSATPVAFLTWFNYVFPSPTSGQSVWFRFKEIFFDGSSTGGISNKQAQTYRLVVP